MFDEEERYRINVFDWQQGFPEIMKAGGFDAVIGNPPYIRMETFKELKCYLRQHYSVHDERTDFYAYFIEREHGLLREAGIFGMIVSNKFLRRQLRTQVAGVPRQNGNYHPHSGPCWSSRVPGGNCPNRGPHNYEGFKGNINVLFAATKP